MNTHLRNLLYIVVVAVSCCVSARANTNSGADEPASSNNGIRKRRGLMVYSVTEQNDRTMLVRGNNGEAGGHLHTPQRNLFTSEGEEDEHVFLTRLLFEGHESIVSSKGTAKPTPPVNLMKKPTHFGSSKVNIHGSGSSKSKKGKGKGGSSKSKKASKSKKGSSKGKGKGGSSKSKKGSSKGKGKGGSSKSKKGSSKGKGKGGSSKSKKGSSKGKGKGGSSKSKKGSSKGKGKGGSSKSKKGSSKGKGKGGSSSKSHRFFF